MDDELYLRGGSCSLSTSETKEHKSSGSQSNANEHKITIYSAFLPTQHGVVHFSLLKEDFAPMVAFIFISNLFMKRSNT